MPADINALVQESIKAYDQSKEIGKSSRLSAGGTTPANIDQLDQIMTVASGAIKAQKAVIAGSAEADKLNTKMQQEVLAKAEAIAKESAEAKGRIELTAGMGALGVQEKNIELARATDLDAIYKQSIQDINLASDRRVNLIDAALVQEEKGKLMNVLTGDATFREFLNATFVDTPSELMMRANVEGAKISYETNRLAGVTAAYTGSVDRNKSTAVNLTAGSVADAATLASNQYLMVATEAEKGKLIAGSAYLQRVVSTAAHGQNVALGEGKLAVDIENSKRAYARFDLSNAEKNPEEFARIVRLGGKFLGSSALTTVTPEALKTYMNNPATKQLATQAFFVGSGLSGYAATDPTGPMPNLLGDAGDAAVLLEDSRGALPTGMDRTQKMLERLATNTEFAMVNGVQGNALKPEQRKALINQKAGMYYQDNAGDIDGTDEYGKPPLKTITQLASMNTDPAIAEFNKRVLTPLAMANDNMPADLIVKATIDSGLPMNTQIQGLVAFAQSVKALNDATARYNVVGLKSASSLPYTAPLTQHGIIRNTRKSVALDDETAVRNYLMKEFNTEQARKVASGLAVPAGAKF